MSNPILYRRRIIPDECVMLKDDIILSCDRERIVTSWKTLHPKKDLHHGMSCYFLQEGFKVSKFCLKDNSLIVTDLLADVIIYPDGFVKVVDLDELVAALESRSISLDTLKSCLMRLDKLLNLIYSNQFDTLKAYIENH